MVKVWELTSRLRKPCLQNRRFHVSVTGEFTGNILKVFLQMLDFVLAKLMMMSGSDLP